MAPYFQGDSDGQPRTGQLSRSTSRWPVFLRQSLRPLRADPRIGRRRVGPADAPRQGEEAAHRGAAADMQVRSGPIPSRALHRCHLGRRESAVRCAARSARGSIQEARKLLGGISRNTIYRLLRTGQLASVVIGCRRFISPAAIAELVARSTTTISPSLASIRSRPTAQAVLPL